MPNPLVRADGLWRELDPQRRRVADCSTCRAAEAKGIAMDRVSTARGRRFPYHSGLFQEARRRFRGLRY